MTRFDDLGRHIAREQDALRARSSVRSEVRARLDALDVPHVQRASFGTTWPLALGATAAAGALAAALTLWIWPSAQAPRALAVTIGEDAVPGTTGTWVEAPSASAVAMRFSDGTRVDVAPSSRARIVELSPNGAHLLLENGLAQVDVKRHPNAAWRVSAGPFAVKVTGTRFDVRWTPEQDAFEFDLHEGHVEISGCVFGQSYELNAGQRAIASCRQGRLNVGARSEMHVGQAEQGETGETLAVPGEPEAAGPHAELDTGASQPMAASAEAEAERADAMNAEAETSRADATSGTADAHTRTAARSRAAAARMKARDAATRWRALAESGRYADAFAVVRNVGFLAACRGADAGELIVLSDLARYGRDYDAAAQALHLLRQRFGGSRQAAQAAFALGKLQFDQDGSYSEAAWWFRTYLREQPSGALAREASGRLLEATSRTGDTAAARDLAAQYLREYPNGPHSALANSLKVDAR
jgi:ferric-dicitrate binding protein FerR (iron transport regulator)